MIGQRQVTLEPTPQKEIVAVFNLYISGDMAMYKGFTTDKNALVSCTPAPALVVTPLYDICL